MSDQYVDYGPFPDVVFRRTGRSADGGVQGEIQIKGLKWPTMEKAPPSSWIRHGLYATEMTYKTSGRRVRCLCFSESEAISKHLIHDADGDDYETLAGCIAPGRSRGKLGLRGSADAMIDIFAALGGFEPWKKVLVLVQNNVFGKETKEQWIARREAALK